MIGFFRRIRKKLADDNKPVKYFRYAIGEILLVVIGILIALQVNNWNEERKLERSQTIILNDLLQSIDNDLSIYEGLFENRLERKREAIDTLVYFSGNNMKTSDSVFMSYFMYVDFDITVRFDSGPYDALKSTGLNQILNSLLREKIVGVYDVLLPSFTGFANDRDDELVSHIFDLEDEILEHKIVKHKNGLFFTKEIPKVDNILQNQQLIKILYLQKKKYFNYKRRLRSMKNILNDLKSEILIELEKI
jgi:hypothetical protein